VIAFSLDDCGAHLVFSDKVLLHFAQHQQRKRCDVEAGGQLFARLTPFEVFIEEATGPRLSDRRTRMSYLPDRLAERAEIREKFSDGLHYVGDWHTHPEKDAKPSSIDKATIADCTHKSSHKLQGFILAVVGNGQLPECLHVSFYPKLTCGETWMTGLSLSISKNL
jgi:integrative and conjugative element protein (TIGR02256 family)